MPVTLPIEVYEAFEKGLGKEEAKIVVKSLETTIEGATSNTWEKTRNELLDRLASKEELKALREDVRGLDNKIHETNNRIDSVMKILLWIMGLIAVQAVAVIVKLIFSS